MDSASSSSSSTGGGSPQEDDKAAAAAAVHVVSKTVVTPNINPIVTQQSQSSSSGGSCGGDSDGVRQQMQAITDDAMTRLVTEGNKTPKKSDEPTSAAWRVKMYDAWQSFENKVADVQFRCWSGLALSFIDGGTASRRHRASPSTAPSWRIWRI
jgi:hypothetical protein